MREAFCIPMLIGLDFDNTLAGYDKVFSEAARAHGYIDSSSTLSKLEVRTRVRKLSDGETKWMALQGEVYGKRMRHAELMPGASDFLTTCRTKNARVVIVSHKTEFGHHDADRVNLRNAARNWMYAHGFFDEMGFALTADAVYFESTRADKVARIAGLKCSHFVDDLEEVFAEPGFPENTTRILYDPTGRADVSAPIDRHSNWKSIEHAIFGN